jgi:DNA-binding transcriptional MerR regulator
LVVVGADGSKGLVEDIGADGSKGLVEDIMENGGQKEHYTIGEVVARLRKEFPTLSVSKVRYLERRRLINLTRTRGGYRLFTPQDVEMLRYILTLQDKEYLPLKVIKKRIEGGMPIASGESGGDLSRVLEDRTYTKEELADAIESEARFVEELLSVGVIGRNGELTQRDVEISRMALEMAKYSIQPRHLRGIMAAVEREAAMFKQILNPELRSGDDQKVQDAVNKARHLAAVDSKLKELMMANVIDSFAS